MIKSAQHSSLKAGVGQANTAYVVLTKPHVQSTWRFKANNIHPAKSPRKEKSHTTTTKKRQTVYQIENRASNTRYGAIQYNSQAPRIIAAKPTRDSCEIKYGHQVQVISARLAVPFRHKICVNLRKIQTSKHEIFRSYRETKQHSNV